MPTSDTFKFKNEPHQNIEQHKEWIKNNPHIARMKPKELDYFKIEVFGYNHKKVADELYKTLKKSGFLKNHPLFHIKIETMD